MQNTQQNLLNSRWAFVQIKSDELSVQHCQVALQIIVRYHMKWFQLQTVNVVAENINYR